VCVYTDGCDVHAMGHTSTQQALTGGRATMDATAASDVEDSEHELPSFMTDAAEATPHKAEDTPTDDSRSARSLSPESDARSLPLAAGKLTDAASELLCYVCCITCRHFCVLRPCPTPPPPPPRQPIKVRSFGRWADDAARPHGVLQVSMPQRGSSHHPRRWRWRRRMAWAHRRIGRTPMRVPTGD
jgi:hypothetical protein